MIEPHAPRPDETDGPVSFWPGLIDLMTAALMLFLLVNFVQTVLDVDQIEALVTRAQQARFMEHFEAEFRDEIARGVISVERRLNVLRITFSDQVLFDSGDYRLKRAGRQTLGRCARLFGGAGGSGYRQIQIEGHTDSLPLRRTDYPSDNWQLASARAISVLEFLTGPGGLPAALFSTSGYADQKPVASNQTAQGRARNRRIEILLLFSLPRNQQSPGGTGAG